MYLCTILALSLLLCLRSVGSEDLYWRPNTDWSNPSNWGLGRAPCEGDVADLSAVPRDSVIKLDKDTVVRSVILPVGSRLELGRSISLRLSNSTTCQIQSSGGPMVAEVKENNTFIGTEPKYWECPQNWGTVDGVEAKSAPCGKDRAFFRDGHYYSSVVSNYSSVSVQYLHVREDLVTTELIPEVAPELKLNLTVNPRCGDDPSLCPCLSGCVAPPSATHSGSDSGTTARIVVPVLLVAILLVAVTIVLVILWLMWRRRNRATPYSKDDLLGEPDDSMHSPTSSNAPGGAGVLFDNPIYEMGVVKGKGDGADRGAAEALEKQTIAILRPASSDYEPVDYIESASTNEPEKKMPILDEYERLP